MAVKQKNTRWLFPTNTNNLRMILAQGLITSPEGFEKYYKDILSDFDGYLPLFNHQIPSEALEKATSEADHLTPCLLEFDLRGVSGQVKILENQTITDIQVESISADSVAVKEQINLPLPLPLGCISKVIFKNKNDMDTFKKEAETRSNVAINKLILHYAKTKTDAKLFLTSTKETPSQQQDLVETNSSKPTSDDKSVFVKTEAHKAQAFDYQKVYALGGLLMSLFYHAKNGELSQQYFEAFSEEKVPGSLDEKDLIAPFAHNYFHSDIDESRPENKLLKGIFSSCIESSDFKNSIISFLQNSHWEDEKLEKRSRELADKLNEYATQNTRSVSEWFDSTKSNNEKILLMLFTREDTTSLIGYQNQNLNFSEQEYVFFALFFGIRDGFIKAPLFLKKYNNLQNYISHQMAAYAHKCLDRGITFQKIKTPLTVWQYVDKKLSKTNVNALSLQSSVRTIMPKKDFYHEKGKNVYTGYFEPTYEVDNKNYFKTISINKITDANYNKLK